jgi:hypothetical protein
MTMDIDHLIAASRRAIERFERATASGSPSEVEAARVELLLIKRRLENAKAEAIMQNEMAASLRTPHPLSSV